MHACTDTSSSLGTTYQLTFASPLQASGQAEASTTPAAPASGQAAASSAPAAAAAAAAPVSAADVARRYYEGYNSKRFDDVLELIADDCVYEGGWREHCNGREGWVRWGKVVERRAGHACSNSAACRLPCMAGLQQRSY